MSFSKIAFSFLLLVFTSHIKASIFNNDTNSVELRKPRVTGRIVKIYSGTKPEPIVCNEEGFKSDPNDCSIFYRCVDIGRGKFSVLRFTCGPGTVYDPDTEVCNHPRSTKRSECNGRLFNKIAVEPVQSQENEIDNVIEQAPPSPITSFLNSLKTTTKRQSIISELPVQRHQTTVKSIIIRSSPINSDEICTSDGFIGDTENCRKFYRCVANGRGGFIRYEFSCSESTMWDEDVQGCNHAWAVKRRRCGRGSDDDNIELAKIKNAVTPAPTYLPQNFGNRLDNNNNGHKNGINKKDNLKSTQASTRRTTQKATTQIVKVFNRQSYGSETEDDGDDDDHTDSNDTTKPPDTTITTTTARPTNNGNKPGTECTSSGFMGDPNDCKKFYRCVDNGRGGYTKYEFSCGDGTVWDSDIEACNHPWAVKNCGGSSSMGSSSTAQASTTSTTTKRTTQATQNTQTTTDSEDEDTGYNNQPMLSTSTEEAQTKPTQNPSSDDVCTKSGFIGDKNNCKKFYRCVDNGKGSYTKYEFSCGEGTVWDPKIEGCNHEWAVEECGESSQDINKVESTTSNSATTPPTTKPPATENDDYDIGYGQQESNTNEDTSSSTTTTARTTTSNNNNKGDKCTKEGFMGDSNDCKKFYRCVSDGKGGFIRYEFTCGEGTVWDSEIDACNHQSAVKNCGQSGSVSEKPTTSEEPSNQETTTEKSNETEGTTSGSHSTVTTTQSSSGSTNSVCTQEGFMGDNSDCKKFYRCVDNQRGGYIKYEFTCGEGTVWDQEIQGCNHPSSTKKCGGSGEGDSTSDQDTAQKPEQEQQSDEMESESTDTPKTTTMRTTKRPSSSKAQCDGEGFYGDPDDCKKFYRCVDDGHGGYTKYDFTCGEGTVWDQEIQGCNHASSNSQCSKGSQGAQTSSEFSAETTDESESPTTTEQSQSSQSSTSSSNKNDECTSEGFYGNSNDCKKFYRCVSDGKGGYTKYDFSCGQGTIWVQEIQACDHDNDLGSCSATSTGSSGSTSSTSSSTTDSPQQPDREDDEYSEPSTTSSSSSSGTCTDEGYYGDENDCRKFYRCVDNGKGGYTKYDFTCGEGTAWDQDIQGCNHENQVKSCEKSNQSSKPDKEESSQSEKPDEEDESQSSQTTEKTSTTQSDSGSSSGGASDKCEKEGFYGNSQDCKKFYRCVDNGNGGLTKYDFDCGEGTIWDQDVQTCNHPGDVANPSCKDGGNTGSGTDSGDEDSGGDSESSGQTSQTTSTTQSSAGGGSSESTTQDSSNCTEDSSKKPSNITCPKAGFYPNPDDCKKFYRCVDWDGDGQRYSVFHFDCGEGTIWDPELETCNYEDSVYPPRDCSNKQSASETESSSTTTEGTTTTESEETTTQQQTTQEQTTQEQTTEEQTTTEQTTTTTTEKSTTTTEQSTTTTTEQSTTEQSTTEQTTTEQSTTEQTTTEQSTTEQSTTEQSTTEQSTTEQSTTEQSTTEQSTTEQSTTEQSTTEQSTTEQSTTEQSTTEQSTTEQSTTEQSTTEQSTTEQSTTEESTTEQSTTEESSTTEQSTTEESTTEESTTESSNKDCPETDDDQNVYVCPTGFRRHPKYCNLFYQCEEDDDSHEVKVAVFNCPNNTIYDESKTQCVDESDADKKCDGEMAERRRFKRLDLQKYNSPILVSKGKRSCPGPGHYPFEKSDECSPAFLKCTKSRSGTIRGFVYRCPEKHVYWTVSRRCEPISKISNCKNIDNSWNKRWEIPLERKNVAK